MSGPLSITMLIADLLYGWFLNCGYPQKIEHREHRKKRTENRETGEFRIERIEDRENGIEKRE